MWKQEKPTLPDGASLAGECTHADALASQPVEHNPSGVLNSARPHSTSLASPSLTPTTPHESSHPANESLFSSPAGPLMKAPHERAGYVYAERTGASMTAIDGRLYIFGGQEPQTGVCFNDVIVFDPAAASWHRATVEGGRWGVCVCVIVCVFPHALCGVFITVLVNHPPMRARERAKPHWKSCHSAIFFACFDDDRNIVTNSLCVCQYFCDAS